MCGIAGVVRSNATGTLINDDLDRMWPGIVSRGPDGRGQYVGAGVGLLNARLAIIDITGSDQPIWNEQKSVVCVLNGEIYNYRALRSELLQRGHHLTTSGDTEVLVHLYEDYGDDLVHHLRGMYAFAIFDLERNRVVLARDRLGIKPLYYARVQGGLCFASTIASLLALDVSSEPNFAAIAEYLRFYKVGEPRTAYQHISTVLPGRILSVDVQSGALTERSVRRSRPASIPTDSADLVAHAREELRRSVAEHLESDVEVAAFLSGGIDSTLVVAEAQVASGRALRTFSVGFPPGGGYDESSHAQLASEQLGTKHETIEVRRPIDALVREALSATNQPFAVASFLPLLLLSERAARDVKVVLTGDGGDEVGLGYPWHRWIRRAVPGVNMQRSRRVTSSAIRRLERYASMRPELRPVRRIAKFGRGAIVGGAGASDRWRYDLESEEAVGLLRQDYREIAQGALGASPVESVWLGAGVEALRNADLTVLLRDEMLPKLDRATMAHGLEGRVPLLGDAFVDAMSAIPASVHLAHPKGKALLRSWAQEAAPGVDFDRPKHGFDVPIHAWLQGDLRPDVDRLLLDRRGSTGLTDPVAAADVWRRMQAGVPGAGHTMYAMLVAEIWFEEFVNA